MASATRTERDNRLAEKAMRYVREGRVQVVTVARSPVGTVYADCLVWGSAPHAYSVQRFAGAPWSCTCQARTEVCAHVIACALVVPDEIGAPSGDRPEDSR